MKYDSKIKLLDHSMYFLLAISSIKGKDTLKAWDVSETCIHGMFT